MPPCQMEGPGHCPNFTLVRASLRQGPGTPVHDLRRESLHLVTLVLDDGDMLVWHHDPEVLLLEFAYAPTAQLGALGLLRIGTRSFVVSSNARDIRACRASPAAHRE